MFSMPKRYPNTYTRDQAVTKSIWSKTFSSVKKLRRGKNSTIFKCYECEYMSVRRFNVTRHYERIHSRERLRECCDTIFYTKGDYYSHCASVHHKTWQSVMFVKKYGIGITNIKKYDVGMKSSGRPQRRRIDIENHKSHFAERRYDTRQHSFRSSKRYKSSISFETMTFTEVDLEDIPLINFLRDPDLMRFFRLENLKSGSSEDANTKRTHVETDEQNETEISGFSMEQSETLMNEACKNYVNASDDTFNVQTGNKNESLPYMTEFLPAKKLLLNRFLTNKCHDCRKPLHPIDHNKNFINTTMKEEMLKKSNFSIFSTDKENMLQVQLEIKQKVKVEIDKNIPLSLMTNLHREFLSSIDFDNV